MDPDYFSNEEGGYAVARGMLLRGGMHPIAFMCKRAHLQAYGNVRRIFKSRAIAPLTPARFDLMYAIRRQEVAAGAPQRTIRLFFSNGREERVGNRRAWSEHRRACVDQRTLDQRSIRARLGLHPATVSEMITRMIELKLLVKRRATSGDRRHTLISITDEGVKLFNRALAVVFGESPIRDAFYPSYPYAKPRDRRFAHNWIHLRFRIIAYVVEALGDPTPSLYRYRYPPQQPLTLDLLRRQCDPPKPRRVNPSPPLSGAAVDDPSAAMATFDDASVRPLPTFDHLPATIMAAFDDLSAVDDPSATEHTTADDPSATQMHATVDDPFAMEVHAKVDDPSATQMHAKVDDPSATQTPTREDDLAALHRLVIVDDPEANLTSEEIAHALAVWDAAMI